MWNDLDLKKIMSLVSGAIVGGESKVYVTKSREKRLMKLY